MTIRRIAVGTDGSEGSQRAVAWTAEMAAALHAEVVAVHALEMTSFPVSMEAAGASAVSEQAFEAWRAEMRAGLEGPWTQPLRDAGVAVRCLLVEGHAAAVLMAMAEAEAADLVVVGSRGRGGFTELLLGSISHQLTHHAHVPVVVVPPAGRGG